MDSKCKKIFSPLFQFHLLDKFEYGWISEADFTSEIECILDYLPP